MKVIAHRGLWASRAEQNTLPALERALQKKMGIETDIRSCEGKIYLSHDAVIDPHRPPRLEDLLSLAEAYPTEPLFLNVKEDGLVGLLQHYRDQIDRLNVVFFDMSAPQLVQFAKAFSAHSLCTRISDIESTPVKIDACEWIWVDGFERTLTMDELRGCTTRWKKNFALVSPDLHGRDHLPFWKELSGQDWIDHSRTALCTDRSETFLEEWSHDQGNHLRSRRRAG